MKFFKDSNNTVYAFESDGSQDGFISGNLIAITPLEADQLRSPTKTIAMLKLEKINEINSGFTTQMATIVNGYPEFEIASWSKQESEARSVLSNAISSTPLIDALALARGLDKSELVARIIAKADMFAVVSGQLIGYRQSLEDAVLALPSDCTAEDISIISW
jgi:hypothetical protein